MAVNYTLAQAVEILAAGEDSAAVMDITKRYPLLAMRVFALVGKANAEAVELTKYIPEYVTANKVNSAIKKATVTEDAESDEDGEEKPKATGRKRGRKPQKPAAEELEGEQSEYADKTAVELFKECKKRGLRAAPKKGQQYYIDILEKDDAAKAEDADTEDDYEDDDDWDI